MSVPGYTITSPTDKTYKWANSKFNTSLACKRIYTFFVATENETCIENSLYIFFEVPHNPYEKCYFIHFLVLGTDEKCINWEKSTCIHFSQFIHFSIYQSTIKVKHWTYCKHCLCMTENLAKKKLKPNPWQRRFSLLIFNNTGQRFQPNRDAFF